MASVRILLSPSAIITLHQSASRGTASCATRAQGHLILQGRAEECARLGEEVEALLGRFGLDPRRLLTDELRPLLLRLLPFCDVFRDAEQIERFSLLIIEGDLFGRENPDTAVLGLNRLFVRRPFRRTSRSLETKKSACSFGKKS